MDIGHKLTMESKKWGMGVGGYVFISHSHSDIVKVRQLRNAMEAQGFEPLCFYLKCLDDNAEDEIFDLITREIDAREWFVYADSPNARKSKWVAKEIEYVTKNQHKTVFTVDLEKEHDMIDLSNRIMNSMRIFMNYSRRDYPLAGRVRDYLVARDLKIYMDMDYLSAGDFVSQISEKIEECSKAGCMLTILTKESVASSFALEELEMALQMRSPILPVIVGDVELPERMKNYMSIVQVVKCEAEVTEADLERIYQGVRDLLLKKWKR